MSSSDDTESNDWKKVRYWYEWTQGESITAKYLGVSKHKNKHNLTLYLFEIVSCDFKGKAHPLSGEQMGLTSSREFKRQMKWVKPGEKVLIKYHAPQESDYVEHKVHNMSVEREQKKKSHNCIKGTTL